MQDPTGIILTAVSKLVDSKPKMSRFRTKLRTKLASVRRHKREEEEEKEGKQQQGRRWLSIRIFSTKGTSPKSERRQATEEAHLQQTAATSESLQHQDSQCSSSTESTVKTSSASAETPSTPLTRDQKFYNNYLKKQEAEARKEREQRRLARRVARWCKGGPIPSLQDFTQMSTKQVSDYLRLKKVTEEWIEVVVSQIEYVREKDEIPPEVEVKVAPSTWPFTEDYTMAICISQLREDGLTHAQIGQAFCQLLYGHDDPIQNAVTKLKDRGYSFTDMGHAMVDLFGNTGIDGKGLVITESKPYVHREAPGEEEPWRSRRVKQKQPERVAEPSEQQQHEMQMQYEINGDWFPYPENLEEERAELENQNSILHPPGLTLPEGYKMHSDGRAYRISKAKFCVPLVDELPAGLPQTVKRRRRRGKPKDAGGLMPAQFLEGRSAHSFKAGLGFEADTKPEIKPKPKSAIDPKVRPLEKVEVPLSQRETWPRYYRLSLQNEPESLCPDPCTQEEEPDFLSRRGSLEKELSDMRARAEIWRSLEQRTRS